ncbi:hypothetical protein JXA31_04850 [Candidatus Bathyarchaeota archaeon]|nr:hypothetical protein [Candidatus Bathyarchaeota archaeon]
MKKTVLCLSFIFALLFSATIGVALVNLATASLFWVQALPEVIIESDGSITGLETGFVNRTGDTYALTANVEGYSLVIERSNIVFDGTGHTINTTMGDTSALELTDVTGVTVKNLEVVGRYTGIYLYYSSNCLITNVKTNNRIYLTDGSNFNTIVGNTVKRLHIGLAGGASNNLAVNNTVLQELHVGGYNNRLYQNNFFLKELSGICSDNFWDNGSVGNYWGNYSIDCPAAAENGNTGIGDTPYVIERTPYTTKEFPNAINIDRYPLLYPWGTPELAMFEADNVTYSQSYPLNFTVNKPTQWMGYSLNGEANVTFTGNVTLSGLAPGLYNLTVYAIDVYGVNGVSETVYFTVNEPFPTALVTTASAASVAAIGVALLVYFKKRKH